MSTEQTSLMWQMNIMKPAFSFEYKSEHFTIRFLLLQFFSLSSVAPHPDNNLFLIQPYLLHEDQ